ncbi:hypothetical protein J3A83DRAFT_2640127 [Scleroderma citrinum]
MGRFYAVTVGNPPGVYDNWPEAAWKVRGVEQPIYQGFPTREEAERVFQAALERGEVMAVSPTAGKRRNKPENMNQIVKQETVPSSPASSEAFLLMTPDKKPMKILPTTRGQGMPSPPPSPLHRLHRVLRDSSISTTPSSPPTEVTQHGLLQTDDPQPFHAGRSMRKISFDRDSPSLLPCLTHGGCPFALMGNQGNRTPSHSSHSKTSSSQESSEEDECTPKTKSPRNRAAAFARGVVYRTYDELVNAKNIDPRIWLPNPPKFDPTKVKARPVIRPPNVVKSSSSATSFESLAESPKAGTDAYYAQSPNVRVNRGRPSRLTPSRSTPVLPSRRIDANVTLSITPSSSPSLRNTGGTREGQTKMCERLTSDNSLGEQPPGYYHTTSPRTESASHIQVVQHEDGSRSSTFRVHCPPSCPHEYCIMTSPTPEIAGVARPKYVDAAVSPILCITARVASNAPKSSPRDRPTQVKTSVSLTNLDDLDAYVSFGLAQSLHVPDKGRLPSEADVRSPIAKGTQVPFSATTTLFGRPTPPTQSPLPRNVVDRN